jgi:ribosomal protein L29
MEEIQSLEDDLMIARSCLVYSEEMREIQYEQIKKLVEDIDLLKAELYHLKFNGN